MSAPKLVTALVIAPAPGASSATNFTSREHVARLGVNYRFNAPMVATN